MSDEVHVPKYPDCDICKYNSGVVREAHYDGKTKHGPWANMCDAHFALDGVGLGTGRGQRLVVGQPPDITPQERREKAQDAMRRGDLDALEEAIGDGDPADFF